MSSTASYDAYGRSVLRLCNCIVCGGLDIDARQKKTDHKCAIRTARTGRRKMVEDYEKGTADTRL